jgi:nitrogen fixation protein FixH
MRRVNVALAAATMAGLGAIGATVWVGAHLREETVVARPYEEGLGQDADRRTRAALGLAVSIEEPLEAGVRPLRFALADRAGRPVEAASATVELSLPETSRGVVGAAARDEGGGRWAADVVFPAPGAWDVRFDVRLAGGRVRLERRVAVSAPCDLADGPCARRLPGGGEVTLELGPRPLRTMAELRVRVEVRGAATATPPSTSDVSVSFSMPGMEMGENRSRLAPGRPGAWEGNAVLVRCPSGRREWAADVEVSLPGASRRTARFPFTVGEERR